MLIQCKTRFLYNTKCTVVRMSSAWKWYILLVTCALMICLICMPSTLGPVALGLRAYISGKSVVPMLQLLLTGEQKGEKSLERCQWILWLIPRVHNIRGSFIMNSCLYLLCHTNSQMHICLIASSTKIITKYVVAVLRFIYRAYWNPFIVIKT